MSVLSQIARLESKAERWPRRFLILAVLLSAACFGPWLVIHFSHLWRREHYQFFPMMLLAVVGLSYASWRNAQQQGKSFETLKFGTPWFAMAALTFSAALWLNSPWLAFLTTITVLWAVFRNVPFGSSSIAPLFVLLPLPFSMDGELVHGLQRISSRGASALLDLVSIRHLMSGNVLELSDKTFFVEEACSGIGSVYLLLASAAIYASWRQLRLVVTIPLLLSAVLWAVAGNTFRIFCVAWAHENLHRDLSSGSSHDILGSVTYLISLLLLIMTEQALLFVFEPVGATASQNVTDKSARSMAMAVGRFWDRRTLMDPEIRIKKFLTIGVSGFRVTRALFIVLVLIFLSLGCAGNIWRFWPELLAVSRAAFPSVAAAADESSRVPEAAPASVIAPLMRLTPNLLNQISELAVVSQVPPVAIDVQPPHLPVDAPATEPSEAGSSPGSRSAAGHVQWNLQLSETPVMLIIEGPCRSVNSAAYANTRDDDHSGMHEWTVIESTTAAVADIASDLPVVREQILQHRQTEFCHELTAEFSQTGSPIPMIESGTLSGIRHELSEAIRSKSSAREEWFWRVTLRFKSDRPIESSVRPSRMAVFGDILKAFLAHWRTPV